MKTNQSARLGILIVLLFFLLSKVFPAQIGKIILLPIIGTMMLSCARRGWQILKTLRPALIRKTWRIVVSCRKMYSTPPEVEVFYIVAFLIGAAFFVYFICINDIHAFGYAGNIIAWLFLLATFLDSTKKIARILKKTWAKFVGKILISSSGAMLIFVATAIAKSAIQSIVHVDPKFFPESVGLLTAITIPFLYFILVIIALASWATLQLLALIILSSLSAILKAIPFASSDNSIAKLIRRARTGKKFPVSLKSSWKTNEAVAFFRPIGMLVSIGLILDYTNQINNHFKQGLLYRIAESAIMLDYKAGSSCRNIGNEIRVVHLEKDLVSIINSNSDSKTYQILRCEIAVNDNDTFN